MAKSKKEDIEEVVLESGIKVKPVYGPEDIKDLDYEREIGRPGEFPFTRGIHPLMYRQRPWTMRQYSGFGSAKETNQRFKWLLEQGQTALNVAFDLPTQLGLDSDDPRAEGEVGRVGMAMDTLKDLEEAFDGIPIDRISTSLTINPVASVMLAMYLVVAEKRGVPLDQIRGTTQNDILKEYVGRGTWIFPVEPSIRLIGDMVEFCSRNVPKFNPFSVCGYHIRESGATPVQEMAYAFEIAITYIQHVLDRGLDIDDFAGRVAFNFDIHGNLWEQVAKFRAGRRLWAKIMKERFGARDPRSMTLRMIAGGGGGGLTIEEPENNIVRGAYYALISALSGTQTMALCSYDEAYTIPSKKAALISLRTMQILADEMGLCDTVDPLAGSYYIEWLTGEMEKKIVECMEKVEEMGGMIKAVESGYIQREVSHQAYLYQKRVQSGEIPKIAVNKYVTGKIEDRDIEFHPFDSKVAEEQKRRLQEVKSSRDENKVSQALSELKQTAKTNENLMPCILNAVRCYATLGEITAVFKEVFGEFKEPVGI
ncbi:MAG: methylmalonyl-CoA mutase [Candidatus Latescibacteria bacterium]|nr:methylmalonyl-CoA mutase [Candidatus Latescibacterota bacterium]NIM64468.1 methylmalonyl-CoA mutase [Candidatus Latescibacterota bacterium]NIO00621.1 methylmalonyl-CoA mutase [Candidatus Latescibacterota bacterium]NIO27022.1 methylmalonyl-CoA mutase [Candidatus Latescibacterota bacterium]NIO56099.1 methylmalonyl-CoA mutase [Candidatus Latescibacterota bacterium]